MGIIPEKKCFKEPSQLIKFIVLFVCCIFTCTQVAQCLEKYLYPPASTHAEFILNDSIRYPCLTICRRPSFKIHLFQPFGVLTSSIESPNAFRNFDFFKFNLTNFFDATTYNFHDIFGQIAYGSQGYSSKYPKLSLKITPSFHIKRGRCFTFQPLRPTDIFSISGGYVFYMFHDNRNQRLNDYGVSTHGFQIYLHQPNEAVTCKFNNIILGTGRIAICVTETIWTTGFTALPKKVLFCNFRKTKKMQKKKNASSIGENTSVPSTSTLPTNPTVNNDAYTPSASSQQTYSTVTDSDIASNSSLGSTVPEPVVIPKPAVELVSNEPVLSFSEESPVVFECIVDSTPHNISFESDVNTDENHACIYCGQKTKRHKLKRLPLHACDKNSFLNKLNISLLSCNLEAQSRLPEHTYNRIFLTE
ncbi:unnamed protein product [Psylliodes chrysocephalus]|uniref:Uncharacterized protein n=1 Tax=Psylliodes chrysocephalus TaxID=3402493 RepID=A0A9P0CL37_9CUCU|nr:unnamed protein product [Psylliodes chrysocephala]